MKSLAARIHAGETGATLVIIVVSMMVLIAFAALAIDMGVAYLDVRGSTNAADDAAMAAALQDCNADLTGMTPQAKALEAAEANGYTDGVVVTESDGVWTVSIATASGGIFGRATPAAPDQIDVNTTSSAECEVIQFLDGYAIFGGGPSCGFVTDISAAGITVNGGIHSNDDIKIQGSTGGSTVNGPITWLGSDNIGGLAGNNSQSQLTGPAVPYPPPLEELSFSMFDVPTTSSFTHPMTSGTWNLVNYGTTNITWNRLADDGYVISTGNGNNAVRRFSTSAIFVTKGTVDLSPNGNAGITTDPGVGVTFVSGGRFSTKKDIELKPYWGRDAGFGPGLLAYAGVNQPETCSTGQGHFGSTGVTHWDGVIFAPNGAISLQPSTAAANNGSLIGRRVNLSGSNFNISYDAGADSDPTRRLLLLGFNG